MSVSLWSQPGNNLSAGPLAQKLKSLPTLMAWRPCQHLYSLCVYPHHCPSPCCLHTTARGFKCHTCCAAPSTVTPHIHNLHPKAFCPSLWLPDSYSRPTPSVAAHRLPTLPPACPATPDQCQPGHTRKLCYPVS